MKKNVKVKYGVMCGLLALMLLVASLFLLVPNNKLQANALGDTGGLTGYGEFIGHGSVDESSLEPFPCAWYFDHKDNDNYVYAVYIRSGEVPNCDLRYSRFDISEINIPNIGFKSVEGDVTWIWHITFAPDSAAQFVSNPDVFLFAVSGNPLPNPPSPVTMFTITFALPDVSKPVQTLFVENDIRPEPNVETLQAALEITNAADLERLLFTLMGETKIYSLTTLPLAISNARYIISLGELVPLPPEPVKEGYTFVGWYLDKALTIAYNGEPITADMTLYAKFAINTFTLTFDSAGGSAVSNQTIDWNTAATLATPTREGYNFLGWYIGETAYTNAPIKTDTALTAKWQIKTFTVTFFMDGEVYQTITVEYGQSLVKAIEQAKLQLNVKSISNNDGTPIDTALDELLVTDNLNADVDIKSTSQSVLDNLPKLLIGAALTIGLIALLCCIPSIVKGKKKSHKA